MRAGCHQAKSWDCNRGNWLVNQTFLFEN